MFISPDMVSRLRAETPGCAHWNHMNNAGAALMPSPVTEAVISHLHLEAAMGGYEAATEAGDGISRAYDSVARLVGGQRRNIAFVENATVAYSQALSAFDFRRGDVIITSENDYISNQIMFLSLQKRFGIEFHRAAELPEGGVDPESVRELIRKHRPRLVAVTWVPTNSGLIQPVEAIGRVCREEDVWFLLDACQAVGQLPIDVDALECDFLSATSRKFLRGPRGSGFLFVSDEALEEGLEPLFIDMEGARWTSADQYRAVETAKRFENWEFAYALVLGTGAAADYALDVGVEDISRRALELADRLRSGLAAQGIEVLDRGTRKAAIVTARIPADDPGACKRALRKRGINTEVSLREYAVIDFDHKGVEWALRLSPHYYNTEEEIDLVVEALLEGR